MNKVLQDMVRKQNNRLDKMEREQKLWQATMESHLRHLTQNLRLNETNTTAPPQQLLENTTITDDITEDTVMDSATDELLTQDND